MARYRHKARAAGLQSGDWGALSAQDRLGVARYKVEKTLKYLAPALHTLTPVEAPWLVQGDGQPVSTAVSEDGFFYWNPAFWNGITESDAVFATAHEVLHPVLDTVGRSKRINADPWTANLAHDIIINGVLREAGLDVTGPLARAAVWAETVGLPEDVHNEWTFEQVYQYLAQKGDEEKDDLKESMGPMNGQCGSGGGNRAPGEPEPNPNGENSEGYQGRSEAEMDRMRQQVAMEGRRLAEQGKLAGNMPMGLRRVFDEITAPPKVRWEDKLKRAIRSCVGYRPGAVLDTYQEMSRLQAGLGYGIGCPVLPGMFQPIPKITVAVDTSGSIGPDQLALAIREMRGVFMQLGCETIEFMSVDCAIHETKPVRSWKEAAKLMKGGGGTSFHPVFEYFETHSAPDLLIIATDGHGPAPATPPGYSVVWLLVGNGSQCPVKWGHAVTVED